MASVTIGIVGGGQLAALLVAEALRHDTPCIVLEDAADCPAAQSGAEVQVGDKLNADDIRALADKVDVLTIDLENVNVPVLAELEAAGKTVVPGAATLTLLTNKLSQKQTMASAGIPTSPYIPFDGEDRAALEAFGFPAVQKAAVGGYDGRGVAILGNASDWDNRLQTTGYLEKFIPNAREISVMVARDAKGQALAWEPVDMVFNTTGNMLDYLSAPSQVTAELAAAAKALALQTIDVFSGTGIFGIEMFLTEADELLVNEIAPRTHNSGHFTIDACTTSQFMQQWLILTGQALQPVTQHSPAVMFNVLGAEGFEGDTVIEGLSELDREAGVYPYLYGKKQCFPLRKMGHVTVIGDTLDEALATTDKIREKIIVRGARRIEA